MPNLIENSSPLLNELDYDNLAANEQAAIDALITVCSKLIEKKCNRIFHVAEYTETLDGQGQNIIFIKNTPINSLSSIKFRDSVDGTLETVESEHFEYDPEKGQIQWTSYSESTSKFLGGFYEGFRNIIVTYNGGYATIPEPIQYLCADMVKAGFSPELSPSHLEKEKLGDYFYQLNKAAFEKILLAHPEIIGLYRRRFIL